MPDMKMQSSEFQELRDQVAEIGLQDVKLGRVLTALVLHLGHAHGLDPAEEDAKAEALRLEEEREAEDEQVKADEEARTAQRAIEDAQTLTPDQQTARATLRKQEDEQVLADEEARKTRREGEDARIAALTEEPGSAPGVEPTSQSTAFTHEEPAPQFAPFTQEPQPTPAPLTTEQPGTAFVQEGN